MIPEVLIKDGKYIALKPGSASTYPGINLPGSLMLESDVSFVKVIVHEWESPLYTIGLRLLHFLKKLRLTIREKGKGVRLEAVLTGELRIVNPTGKKLNLISGQYHITAIPEFTALLKKGTACNYFITHYSYELLDSLGLTATDICCGPRTLNSQMDDLIQEMLRNPYEEKLRDFYYENCIRELLFFHLTGKNIPLPGELTDKEIAAVYHIDTIIQQNLNAHFTIRALSKMAGTNEFKLKKAFRQVFGMGLFGRLLYRRMEQAKRLLETTNKSILEVSREAGYESLTGFIHAFRKRFGMSPTVWRQAKGGGVNDNDK